MWYRWGVTYTDGSGAEQYWQCEAKTAERACAALRMFVRDASAVRAFRLSYPASF